MENFIFCAVGNAHLGGEKSVRYNEVSAIKVFLWEFDQDPIRSCKICQLVGVR